MGLQAPKTTPNQRTISLDTGKRSIDLPVDSLGRERLRGSLDIRSMEKRDDSTTAGFAGHAAIFNSRTWIGPKKWGFFEQVAEGAFDKTIGEADVRFLVNHNPDLLIARTKSDTLKLSVDEQGLYSEADMDLRQSYVNDLAISLERGDVTQMSFAFEVVKDQWEVLDDENESELRTLLEVRLWDVSAVTYPAYEDTDAGLRGSAFDAICRSAGLDDKASERLMRSLNGDGDLAAAAAVIDAAHDLGVTEPAAATRSDSDPEPAESTRVAALDHKRQLKARASRYGLPV